MKVADLDWRDGGVPVARDFDDVYYCVEDGLGESRHVFLNGNDLPNAWDRPGAFTICETGFGTGLNFLAARQLWRKTRRPDAYLHYVSVEGFPLSKTDLAKALQPWEELRQFSEDLLCAYPDAAPGFHRMHFSDRVSLTLLSGDVVETLAELEATVDAWFLDGFAPSRNPQMWRAEMFHEMSRLSRPGATVATYTVAGHVRAGLRDQGFDVAKAAGFSRKRDMLRGQYIGPMREARGPMWFKPPDPLGGAGQATIIGGGIAGAATAYALAKRDWRVTLIERHSRLAQETSGNSRAMVMPRLTLDYMPRSAFYAACYRYVLQEIKQLQVATGFDDFDFCGALQLALDEQSDQRHQVIAASGILADCSISRVSSNEASAIAGIGLDHPALYFPDGGWVSPRRFCEALASDADSLLNVEIEQLPVAGREKQQNASCVIIANGADADSFLHRDAFPFQYYRGQVTLVPSSDTTQNLNSILAFGPYVAPAQESFHLIGATYDPWRPEYAIERQAVLSSDHKRNLDAVSQVLPSLAVHRPKDVQGWAALRCTTADRQPMLGPVPDIDHFVDVFAGLANGHQFFDRKVKYQAGLYVHAALGSQGFTTALLSAELLASQICGDPWPLPRSVAHALHPARFLMRKLKRGTFSPNAE